MLMLWSSYRIKHSSALCYSWNCKYLGCIRNAFWWLLKSMKGSRGNKILTCRKWLAWEVVLPGEKRKCSQWPQCLTNEIQKRYGCVLEQISRLSNLDTVGMSAGLMVSSFDQIPLFTWQTETAFPKLKRFPPKPQLVESGTAYCLI